MRAFGLSETDAEDVFQDVFARTFERLDSLRDDTAVRPWLAQLTRNACIDRLRAGAREELTADPDAETADAAIETLDEALAVHEALRALSGDCREILDRFFARDESYRSIGEALELPPARSRAASPAVSESCARSSREEIRRPPRLEISERHAPLRRSTPGRAARTATACARRLGARRAGAPQSRRQLDEIVELARADAEFRARVVEDLEAALAAAGFTPEPALLDAVRARLPELDR